MFFDLALPVLAAIIVWWFGTGLIIYLDGMKKSTYRWSMLGATVATLAAVAGIYHFAAIPTVMGAGVSFVCGVVVWGWIEMSFLMGYITGPRRTVCPPDSRGMTRARHAVEAILYHEIAIFTIAAGLLWLTWGAANQTGTWTFFLLMGMRLSAKLNLFLGVRNRGVEFLPESLKYLASYFANKSFNIFFPFAMAVACGVLVLLISAIAAPEATAFEATAHTFLAALMGLAILEHVFMIVSVDLTALWGWSFRSRKKFSLPNKTKIDKRSGVTPAGRPAIGGQHEL